MREKQKETHSAEYLRGHADGWEKGYKMGFKTQPDLNRKYLIKQIEKLQKQINGGK